MESLRFGAELQDQIPQLGGTLNQYLGFLSDISDFYAGYAQLEREYASNFKALIRKTQEKRSRRTAGIVVGEAPNKAFRDGDPASRQHTVDSAWVKTLSVADEMASDRLKLADDLDGTANAMRTNAAQASNLLKTHHSFYASRMMAERDRLEDDRKAKKAKYDSTCAELESARQKVDAAKDEDKAQRNYARAESDMRIAKNTYLLSISVTNSSKSILYQRDLPVIHDHFQLIWTLAVSRLKDTLTQQCHMLESHINFWHDANSRQLQSVAAVDAAADQAIYIDYNKRSFFPPTDQAFEPCALWHDNDQLTLEGEGKTFLQSVLANRKKQLEAPSQLDQRLQDVDKFNSTLQTYANTPSLANTQEMSENMFEAHRQALAIRMQLDILATERDACSAALGDDIGAPAFHDLKASTFAKPHKCVVCEQNIWGMSKSIGVLCRHCGVACHSKCQIQVLADCSKGKPRQFGGDKFSLGSIRSKRSSVASTVSSGDGHSTRQVPPSRSSSATTSVREQKGTMLYEFTAQSAFEVSVAAGTEVIIITPDDGSGWTKIQAGNLKGIVPSSYIQSSSDEQASEESAVEERRAMAPYQAAGDNQVSIEANDAITVLSGDESGWTLIRNGSGEEGYVPSWAV